MAFCVPHRNPGVGTESCHSEQRPEDSDRARPGVRSQGHRAGTAHRERLAPNSPSVAAEMEIR